MEEKKRRDEHDAPDKPNPPKPQPGGNPPVDPQDEPIPNDPGVPEGPGRGGG